MPVLEATIGPETETKERIYTKTNPDYVKLFKQRILQWENPVEFVNNMYGTHPAEKGDKDYFTEIFKRDEGGFERTQHEVKK